MGPRPEEEEVAGEANGWWDKARGCTSTSMHVCRTVDPSLVPGRAGLPWQGRSGLPPRGWESTKRPELEEWAEVEQMARVPVGQGVEHAEDADDESTGEEDKEVDDSLRRRAAAAAVDEEVGRRSASEDPEGDLWGRGTAPHLADMTIVPPVDRWKTRRLRTFGSEAEDPASAADQDEAVWTPEVDDAVWVAGCVWKGWRSIGVVRPPGLAEGSGWAVGACPLTRAQYPLQAW